METIVTQKTVYAGEVLPKHYGEDRFVLLPRDPHWIFAYWEISPATEEKVQNEWGRDTWQQIIPKLRVYRHAWEREGAIENYFDITLDRGACSWYIKVNYSDHYYHADLGWEVPGVTFYPVLKSNLARTPRDGISHIVDENWKLPDWKTRRLFHRISLYHLSSPEFLRPPGYKQRITRKQS